MWNDVAPASQAHSQSADDLLPGLCALAQQWLGDVLLPSFACCTDTAPALDAWFRAGRVKLHLQASCTVVGTHFARFAHPTALLLLRCVEGSRARLCVHLDDCSCTPAQPQLCHDQ